MKQAPCKAEHTGSRHSGLLFLVCLFVCFLIGRSPNITSMQLISDTELIVELTDMEESRIRGRRNTRSVRNTDYQVT